MALAQQDAAVVREQARLAWVALTLTPGMGPTRIWKAMNRLGAAEQLLEASLTELEGTGMPAQSAQFVFEGKAKAAAEEELKRVAEAGGKDLNARRRSLPRTAARDLRSPVDALDPW